MAPLKRDDLLLLEILDNLIREEKRGHQYFREAAIISSDPEVKRLFEKLSEDELEHLEILTKLREFREALRQSQSSRKTIRMDGEIVNILDLSDMASQPADLPRIDLFNNREFAELFKSISPRAVVEYAMKIEYDNARYIKDFAQHIESRQHRELLIRLIEQEKQHFLALQQILRRYT